VRHGCSELIATFEEALLDVAVPLRELIPQTLKKEIDRFFRKCKDSRNDVGNALEISMNEVAKEHTGRVRAEQQIAAAHGEIHERTSRVSAYLPGCSRARTGGVVKLLWPFCASFNSARESRKANVDSAP